MATPRLLRLKSELIAKSPGQRASHSPVARVLVDTGVDHLDQLYDYFVPQEFADAVVVGIRVQVPFSHKESEAIVISRHELAESSGPLKTITKVLSTHPVATEESLSLALVVANRWACSLSDILRSSIPPRISSVDKKHSPNLIELRELSTKTIPRFIALKPHSAPLSQICEEIDLTLGSHLVIVPDERDLLGLLNFWNERNPDNPAIALGSSLTRRQRYSNYLDAMSTQNVLVVGTRSAVFAPVGNLHKIIVYKESSPDYYDQRSPGWNVRDVALLRNSRSECELAFLSFVPSLVLAVLIDEKRVLYVHENKRVRVRAFAPTPGALLPQRIFTPIREVLKRGPVLFLVARKGYGNALLCAQCRNYAQCSCGGRLKVLGGSKAPQCSHCAKQFPDWKCSWCQSTHQYVVGRGIERASEEIGRAFPNIPIVMSHGDAMKDRVNDSKSIVISTPGAQPVAEKGYAGVVILDALTFFSHEDLASQERARELFFESSGLVRSDGDVIIAMEDTHPIVSAITQWNPSTMIQRELRERNELGLPPYGHSALIRIDTEEASQLASGLRSSIAQGRIDADSTLLGPVEISPTQSKIILRFSDNALTTTTQFLRELQRKRGIAKKSLLYLRIDPYSLS